MKLLSRLKVLKSFSVPAIRRVWPVLIPCFRDAEWMSVDDEIIDCLLHIYI